MLQYTITMYLSLFIIIIFCSNYRKNSEARTKLTDSAFVEGDQICLGGGLRSLFEQTIESTSRDGRKLIYFLNSTRRCERVLLPYLYRAHYCDLFWVTLTQGPAKSLRVL